MSAELPLLKIYEPKNQGEPRAQTGASAPSYEGTSEDARLEAASRAERGRDKEFYYLRDATRRDLTR